MDIKYDLLTIINLIKVKASNVKISKSTKLGEEEYLVTNITEEDLLDESVGFEYIGKDFSQTRPMYKKANIEGFFEEATLHLYKVF